MMYGYARVSTDGQSVDAQLKQLRAAGAAKVYRDTARVARGDRAQRIGALPWGVQAVYPHPLMRGVDRHQTS
jgi:hypothetical protein